MNLSRIYFTSPVSLENSTVEQDSTSGLVDDRIARNATKKALNPRRKKYNEYTASDRFRIGKYGMENGSRRIARAFQKEFPNLNASSVRNFMKKYAKEQGHKKKMKTRTSTYARKYTLFFFYKHRQISSRVKYA